jgi:outer membrane protein TolC
MVLIQPQNMKKFIQNRYFVLGMILLLAISCRTGKNYQRPTVLMPQSFNQAANAASDTNSIGDISWRNYFSDPVLLTLIDSGIARNYDLQYALRNISIAQQQVKQANWLWYPQLTAGSPGNITAFQIMVPQGKNGELVIIMITWLQNMVGNRRLGKIQQAEGSQPANYLQTMKQQSGADRLVADIAQGYFSLLMLD